MLSICDNYYILITFILNIVWGQHPKCNYMQYIAVNQTGFIYTPRFPRFVKDMSCRWLAQVPEGYNCKLYCKEFFSVFPQTPSCSDRVLVSRSGDVLFESADLYCGRGPINTISFGNNISVGLIANFKTRLSCTIKAIPAVDHSCRCGWSNAKTRLIADEKVEETEFPFVAGIMIRSTMKVHCIGLIVDRKHVLTTARCITGLYMDDMEILAGERALTDKRKESDYKVNKIKIHPMYSTDSYDFDAALLELSKEIQYTEDVGPVCLPFKFVHEDLVGDSLTVLGTTDGWLQASSEADSLVKIDVQVTSLEECKSSSSRITSRLICTFAPKREICQEHPGGPLLLAAGGSWFAAGAARGGQLCASAPRAGPRTARLLHWLTTATKADYCRH